MSATFIAAGPDFRQGVEIEKIHNIDIAPTVLEILDVEPASTVDGRVIRKALEQPRHCDWKHWWRCWDDRNAWPGSATRPVHELNDGRNADILQRTLQ